MIQIILAVLFIVFAIFLKQTNHPGFRGSKKFWKMFIILGVVILLSRLASSFLSPL
ncbi:hypothetical protein NAL32_08565 [Chryseobacterium sp. Ch-15]|uniref:Uncharacterized protein n=1 Tax=Chryseobacterium muglaense TaxID=2893752 RepID=A0A9Q3YUG9_9FLAO|nr:MULTISPECIES: hypothetical protein [Chryseobacterium]MBD3902995.1 hypothetical protein [Chryseobacterium muglaense]MBO6186169.1 hypothetical protein [Chryseobacterium sp.]MCC9035827.1 hypothetical protein [Chryseobacterium muglaense]MCM2554444.1 hypothetical protein [Chryseobacterium muglaense]